MELQLNLPADLPAGVFQALVHVDAQVLVLVGDSISTVAGAGVADDLIGAVVGAHRRNQALVYSCNIQFKDENIANPSYTLQQNPFNSKSTRPQKLNFE